MMDQTRVPFFFTASHAIRFLFLLLVGAAQCAWIFATARAVPLQDTLSTTWAVTIVLPPKLVAGRPATLAVLGVDGRLAEGMIVDLGAHSGIDVRVKTDKTGRGVFLAPTDASVLIVKASGAAAAALVDRLTAPNSKKNEISLPPVVSRIDAFPICGSAFHGQADANHIKLNEIGRAAC